MAASDLGPLVRLRGLRTSQLPPPTASPSELAPLLSAILREAVPFIDSVTGSGSNKVWKKKGSHKHPDSEAAVEVLERVVSAKELERVVTEEGKEKGKGKGKRLEKGETWCCRRSVHEDKPGRGTASWDEFVRSFRDEHAESERAFTPACVDARQALAWDCGDLKEASDGGGGKTWGRFSLVAEEMRHRIGRPVLKDRTFPVLQMTATCISSEEEREGDGEGGNEFVVVSIPVPDFGTSEMSKLAREKDAQVARYVSVERIRRVRDGEESERKVEWIMATASDAGGVLPAWVQNVAAPGVIWKDVPLFLGWIAGERAKRQGQSQSESQVQGQGQGEGSR
ncbi:hypothetical protein Daesc_010439 [Daldinia eschscholtzii]|uniref:DUF3074 domain-containing protein n=1 Tax=Daldinia eschscholtzii TaxID=292717 RepID=A0AAX6M7P1_9PEZI